MNKGGNRLRIVCEGKSEELFVKNLLGPYLNEKSGWTTVIIPMTVVTSRDLHAGRGYKGG